MRKHGENGQIELIDLTGQKFGWLTVISYVGLAPNRAEIWLCMCGCGKTSKARKGDLQSGKVTSCGCKRSMRMNSRMKKGRCNGTNPGPKTHSAMTLDPEWDSFEA